MRWQFQSPTEVNMSLKSIVENGTKVWLDGIEPGDVRKNRPRGITGATSNPIIISDIIKAGGLDSQISKLLETGDDDSAIGWKPTDHPVRDRREGFRPAWPPHKGGAGPG